MCTITNFPLDYSIPVQCDICHSTDRFLHILRVLRWLLPYEHPRDVGRQLLSILVQHAEEAVLRRRLVLMIPLLSVLGDLVHIVGLDSEEGVHGLRADSVGCSTGTEAAYLRRLCCLRVTVVRHILVDEYCVLRDTRRVFQDSEAGYVGSREQLIICRNAQAVMHLPQRMQTHLHQSIELGADRLKAFGNSDGIVKNCGFDIHVVGVLKVVEASDAVRPCVVSHTYLRRFARIQLGVHVASGKRCIGSF